MAKRPGEVFGYRVTDLSVEAQATRQSHWCPFVDLQCYKQSRLIDYPMGVCSVDYDDEMIAICPRRFLQDRKVFEDIADQHFGARADLLIFPEVRLPSIGTFDYVMVKHSPMSADIEDFAIIEFQTGQTTGTGKLVQALEDFMGGEDLSERSYAFGLNTYDVWKRSFTQILNKGIVLEAWNRKIYWVVQQQIFRYLVSRYHLSNLEFQPHHSTVFSTYDLQDAGSGLDLVQVGQYSSSIDELFTAFRSNPEIPTRQQFESALRLKLEANLGRGLG